MTTAESDAMKRIVSVVHPALKERRFRKRGNAFNHGAEPGCVHVVHFQMGAFNPPGTVEIPGLRPNLYGRFTVNLGVYLDEIREQRGFPTTAPSFVNEYSCHLRNRLGFLIDPPGDRWWPLGDPDAVGPAIRDLIAEAGFAWFDALSSRDRILAALESAAPDSRHISGGPDRLLATEMSLAAGELARAQRNFGAYVSSSEHAPSHQEYLQRMAAQHGLNIEPDTMN